MKQLVLKIFAHWSSLESGSHLSNKNDFIYKHLFTLNKVLRELRDSKDQTALSCPLAYG